MFFKYLLHNAKITLQYVHQTYVLKHDGFGDICTSFISKLKNKDTMMRLDWTYKNVKERSVISNL